MKHYCRLSKEALEDRFKGCRFHLSSHSSEVPKLHYGGRVGPLYRIARKEDNLGARHKLVYTGHHSFFKDRIVRSGLAGDLSSTLLEKGGVPSIGRRTPKEFKSPKNSFGVEVLSVPAEATFP